MRWGLWLIALGGLLVGVGGFAERWHSRKFRGHVDRLEHLLDSGEREKAAREVSRFAHDESVDRAISLMMLEPVGVALVILGLVLWLGPF